MIWVVAGTIAGVISTVIAVLAYVAPPSPAGGPVSPNDVRRSVPPVSESISAATAGGSVTPGLLGPPDFNGYCQATGQGTVHLIANNAYGWRCTAGSDDDAQAVCVWTYHTDKITNRVADFNDPHSWECWQANRRLGWVDFNAYCAITSRGESVYTGTGTAYGWFCTANGDGIDTQDACKRLYGNSPPISRFQNFYDRYSWECWG